MEVFHMYVVLITHRDNMEMAHHVVQICSGPMIVFTGLGLALSSIALQVLSGEWKNPFKKVKKEEEHLSDRFQTILFFGIIIVFAINFLFTYFIQSQTAIQNAHSILEVFLLYKLYSQLSKLLLFLQYILGNFSSAVKVSSKPFLLFYALLYHIFAFLKSSRYKGIRSSARSG